MVLHRDTLVIGSALIIAAALYAFTFRDLLASGSGPIGVDAAGAIQSLFLAIDPVPATAG
jgi:hypothetical protein